MSLLELAFLFLAMASLALVPSTGVALVVLRSSTAGFLNGTAVAAGIVVGDLVFVLLAILGMTVLAELMGSLFLLFRYVAAAYLLWFGINLLRAKPSFLAPGTGPAASTYSTSFASGLALTLGDVKAIFFYASLFPVFVDLGRLTAADVSVIVMITVVAVGGVKVAYAYFAMKAVALLQGFQGGRGIRITAGSGMAGAGLYLLLKP